MTRRNKTQRPARKIQARDSFSNILARIGLGTPSLLEATEYPINRLTRDYALMNSLYRNHWIVRRVIDTVPEDMCKNWITLKPQVAPDYIKRFARLISRTQTKKKVNRRAQMGAAVRRCSRHPHARRARGHPRPAA